MLSRDEALTLIKSKIKNQNLIKHMLASEAIIKSLARKLGEPEEEWGIVGLIHDLDFEETKDDPKKHTLITAEILKDKGFTDEQIQAIKAHNAENTGVERQTKLDYALTCAEQITGLIVACALVQPDKKLASVTPESILKKFKQKAFAANVSRQDIQLCEKLGLSLEEFVDLGLKAMQEISDNLGI